MKKRQDLIPRKDATFDTFQDQLVVQVTANQATWQIPLTEIGKLTTPKGTWDGAWLVAKDKTTRTPVQISAKRTARKNYVAVLRPFIQTWIQGNSNMTDEDRLQCGVKPRVKDHTPVPDPDTAPTISIRTVSGNGLRFTFRQPPGEDGTSKRGKPAGVARVELFYTWGATPPQSASDCPHSESNTRAAITLFFQGAPVGQRLYAFGRYLNTTDKPGPWTIMYSVIIPG